ncbi:putative uncharacterized protein C8orf44 [Plecturocebus cupreus]
MIKSLYPGQVQWLMPVIPAFWEAKAGRSLEAWSLRTAWQYPVSTNNTKLAGLGGKLFTGRVRWLTPIIPALSEAEAGGSPEGKMFLTSGGKEERALNPSEEVLAQTRSQPPDPQAVIGTTIWGEGPFMAQGKDAGLHLADGTLSARRAEVGGLLELRSSRPAEATRQYPVSTKNAKISQVWWHAPVVPATQEAQEDLLPPLVVQEDGLQLGERADGQKGMEDLMPMAHDVTGTREVLFRHRAGEKISTDQEEEDLEGVIPGCLLLAASQVAECHTVCHRADV